MTTSCAVMLWSQLTVGRSLLSARTAMWSMPVVLTEAENENDSANQNYVAKMTLQKRRCKKERAPVMLLADGITSTNNPLISRFTKHELNLMQVMLVAGKWRSQYFSALFQITIKSRDT